MSHKRWKPRLGDMVEAVTKILSYTMALRTADEFQNDKKTFDACVRNFQILGDAANHIRAPVKGRYPKIPWAKIKGMRNILVHEYFGASPEIIWNTIQNELPILINELKTAAADFEKTSHPWKICPVGEYFVHGSDVDAHLRAGNPVKPHLRRDHCREYSRELVNILTKAEAQMMTEVYFNAEFNGRPLADLGFKKRGSQYDTMIQGWVKFWNQVLLPAEPLDPNMFKALLGSESSFIADEGRGKRGAAKGLGQLMPLTLKALGGYRNELKDHLVVIDSDDALDPNLNIAASVRWLFQKRVTASRRLKRPATWIEAVEDYKDVLRRRLRNPKMKQKAMDQFNTLIGMLEGK